MRPVLLEFVLVMVSLKAFTFLTLYLLIFSHCEGRSVSAADPYIYWGKNATIEEMPWLIQVERYGSSICAGVILSENYALTSAQCIGLNSNLLRVRAGTAALNSGGSEHHLIFAYGHPDYDIYYWQYDVAVLKVDPPFTLDATRQPLKIGTEWPKMNSTGLIGGWGNTENASFGSPLLAANTTVTNYDLCDPDDVSLQFCTAPDDGLACSGDWGTPFVQDGVVLGIGSLFQYCRTYNTYTSVTAKTNRDFIMSTAELTYP